MNYDNTIMEILQKITISAVVVLMNCDKLTIKGKITVNLRLLFFNQFLIHSPKRDFESLGILLVSSLLAQAALSKPSIYKYALLAREHLNLSIYIFIYGYKYIFRSNSRGSRYARAFAPTDLLTSLREESCKLILIFTFSILSIYYI